MLPSLRRTCHDTSPSTTTSLNKTKLQHPDCFNYGMQHPLLAFARRKGSEYTAGLATPDTPSARREKRRANAIEGECTAFKQGTTAHSRIRFGH